MVRSLSRTEKNLWSAFLGEAKANRMYTAFAMRAMEEGHPEIAQVFLEAAGAETIHAVSHLKALGEIHGTLENLRTVSQGEAYEIATMYPRMIQEAEEEARPAAAASFRLAWEREKHHLRLFQDALKVMGVPDAASALERQPQMPEVEIPRLLPIGEVGREKTRIAALARIREVIFGMQDGLISTAILVSSVYGATGNNFVTVVAGLAGGVGGMFSMAAGSFLSSRAERELYQAEILREARELEVHPGEEIAELMELYRQEGFSYEDATAMAERVAQDKGIMLRTMVEKELGLAPELPGSPWKDSLTMGVSFIVGATVPILPYFLLGNALVVATSLVLTGVGLFAMGVGKARFTHRNPVLSGVEVLLVGTLAAGVGYFLGTLVPGLFGAPGGA
ncbi:MAG: VIT1/CCC1 transporter family protein [Chloroflexi bacterium]|nr:VIT1/CCC1 transporter family protein [Chloroflexota bacterium]